jgi:hypothetical protein
MSNIWKFRRWHIRDMLRLVEDGRFRSRSGSSRAAVGLNSDGLPQLSAGAFW